MSSKKVTKWSVQSFPMRLPKKKRHKKKKKKKKVLKKAATTMLDNTPKYASFKADLIQSEEEYIKYLEILVEMKEYLDHDSLDIEPEIISKIWGNSSVLCDFHKRLLAEIKTSENVPSTFAKYVPFFKLYNEYMASYDEAMETVIHLEQNDAFQSFLKLFKKRYRKTLRALILFPVKRVHQYLVSFESLKIHTPQDHPRYQILVDLCSKIAEVATHITESQKNRENMSKLRSIQRRVGGQIDLIAPHRKIIRESVMRKESGVTTFWKERQVQPRVVFLFSDMIMWTDPEYGFRDSIPLSEARVTLTDDPCEFEVFSALKSNLFMCDDTESRDKWVEEIKHHIGILKAKRNFQRRTRYKKSNTLHKMVQKRLTNLQETIKLTNAQTMPVKRAYNNGAISPQPQRLVTSPPKMRASGLERNLMSPTKRNLMSPAKMNTMTPSQGSLVSFSDYFEKKYDEYEPPTEREIALVMSSKSPVEWLDFLSQGEDDPFEPKSNRKPKKESKDLQETREVVEQVNSLRLGLLSSASRCSRADLTLQLPEEANEQNLEWYDELVPAKSQQLGVVTHKDDLKQEHEDLAPVFAPDSVKNETQETTSLAQDETSLAQDETSLAQDETSLAQDETSLAQVQEIVDQSQEETNTFGLDVIETRPHEVSFSTTSLPDLESFRRLSDVPPPNKEKRVSGLGQQLLLHKERENILNESKSEYSERSPRYSTSSSGDAFDSGNNFDDYGGFEVPALEVITPTEGRSRTATLGMFWKDDNDDRIVV